jgi:hypothetical protein
VKLNYSLSQQSDLNKEHQDKGFTYRFCYIKINKLSDELMTKSFRDDKLWYFANELATFKLIKEKENRKFSKKVHFVELFGYMHESCPCLGMIITKNFNRGTLHEYCRKINNGWIMDENGMLTRPIISQLEDSQNEISTLMEIAQQISEGKFK